MTEQSSGFLALKLRQNWLSRYPDKPESNPQEQDDSLTNLNWLQHVNLTKLATPEISISPPPITHAPFTFPSEFTNGASWYSTPRVPLHEIEYPKTIVNTEKQYIDLYSTETAHARPSMLLGSNRHVAHRTSGLSRQSSDFTGRNSYYFSSGRQQCPHAGCRQMCPHNFPFSSSSNISGGTGSHTNYTHLATSGLSSDHSNPAQNGTVLSRIKGPLSSNCLPPHSVQNLSNFTNSSNSCTQTYPANSTSVANIDTNHSTKPQESPSFPENTTPRGIYPSSITMLRKPFGTGVPFRTSGGCFSSSYFIRHDSSAQLRSIPVDTIDASTSGLFVTLDSIDPQLRDVYRTNPSFCPPFSFHSLVYMSMKWLKRNKITMKDAQLWIMENFAYYRNLSTNWLESLRQNIASSRCFQRVPRRKEDPGGKRDLWRLNPEFQTQLANNKISPKFLHFWQQNPASNYDRENACEDRPGSAEQSEDTPSSPSGFPMQNVIHINDGLGGRMHRQGLKRRRNTASDRRKLNTTEEQCCGAIPISDTAYSTSSSSPPLSDINTPPPQLAMEQSPVSPLQSFNEMLGIGATVFVEETRNQNRFHSMDGYTPNAHSVPAKVVSSAIHVGTSTTSQTSAYYRMRSFSGDTDGAIELSNACGLSEIPPLDLATIGDPLDLTIRGVGFKASSDWWNGSLSSSVHHLMTVAVSASGDDQGCGSNVVLQVSGPSLLSTPESELNEVPISLAQLCMESDTTQSSYSVSCGYAPNQTPNMMVASPLTLVEDHKWIDEQLNLEELDSILGLS